MFDIEIHVTIPLMFKKVEGKTMYEASENVRKLNQEEMKKRITLSVKYIKEV